MRRSKAEIESIYNEYLQGSTLKELDKKYSTDTCYLFKRHNLKSRTTSETRERYRKTCIKLRYNFESISNETEAYIVGLLLADGYVGESQIGIKLKKSDKNLLLKIKNYFSEEIKLQECSTSFGFVISSKIACQNAINIGLSRNKTQKELYIPNMNEEFLSHFVRGYFDGDGSIFKCSNKFLKLNICSPTINILLEIQKIFKANNIYSCINEEQRIGKTLAIPTGTCVSKMNMYRLFVRKKEDLKILYSYFYDNAELFLQRKKDVFDNNKDMLIYKKARKT